MKKIISLETRNKIKQYREQGIPVKEIAEKLGVCRTSIYYWSGKKETIIKQTVERYKKLPKEKKKEIYKRHKEYNAKYFKERYWNDPVFRQKVREWNRINKKKKYDKLKELDTSTFSI